MKKIQGRGSPITGGETGTPRKFNMSFKMNEEPLTFLSPVPSKHRARNYPNTSIESGFKERLTTCTSDLEKALPLISPLKRQRPSEWDIYTNQEEEVQKKQAVTLGDDNDCRWWSPFFDLGYAPDSRNELSTIGNCGRREVTQSSEKSVSSHVDQRKRPRGGIIFNRLEEADLCFRPAPVSRRCIQKRRRAEGSLLATRVPPTLEELQETWKMIDHWQEQMNQILAEDWEYKRKHWVQQCHSVLWNVKEDSTLIEKPSSEMFPRTLLPITMLNKKDQHWLDVLISSARVDKIKSPDFEELTHDPQGNQAMDEEFEFEIQFQFGFDIEELKWYIHAGVAKQGINEDLCSVIAEFLGRSKFICDVQIYFKKSVTPWWEQDGIAKMQHYSKGKYVDMIDFAPMEEVYFVQEWPMHHFLMDDYTEYNLSNPQQPEEAEDPKVFLEKKFIAAVCCHIVHLCICKTQPPQSCAARNILKQISMVLKGWFIGVLLGEALNPGKVKFEYDTRAPSLAPRLSTYSHHSHAV